MHSLLSFLGIVKLTVLSDDVPQLLSIRLLEHTEALIDTDTNKRLGTDAIMKRLASGHLVLDVVDGACAFQPPSQVLKEYDLSPRAFEVSNCAAASAYLGATDGNGDVGRPVSLSDNQQFSINIWNKGSQPKPLASSEKPWEVFWG